MSIAHRILASAVLLVPFGVLGACANTATTTSGSSRFDIQATTHSIYEGEIVTVTTRTLNTLGDASVEWSTTGGKLSTEKEDRIARVKFDQPGHYTITANLKVDGKVVDTEKVDVNVKPLTEATGA
jgi:hypothetical protein